MKKSRRLRTAPFLNLLAILVLAGLATARPHSKAAFEYVGGTELMPEPCEGRLALTQTALVYECGEARITVPYASITRMEYRSKVSPQVRKMKLHWVQKPPRGRSSKHNLFFTVLYRAGGGTHAMILKVLPEAMRPYLAEIDLRVGRRIDIERHH